MDVDDNQLTVAIGEPWDDPDDEYQVLVDLLVPSAQAGYERALSDWNALDTKILGLLALDAALIAGLAAAHDSIHRAWWLPAVIAAMAAGFFIASLWPRTVDLGANPIDFHKEMREGSPLDAARAMVEHLFSSAERVDERIAEKGNLYWVGLALFSVALVASLPMVVFRP